VIGRPVRWPRLLAIAFGIYMALMAASVAFQVIVMIRADTVTRSTLDGAR